MATPHGVGRQVSWEGMLSGKSAVRTLGDAYKGQPCTGLAPIIISRPQVLLL